MTNKLNQYKTTNVNHSSTESQLAAELGTAQPQLVIFIVVVVVFVIAFVVVVVFISTAVQHSSWSVFWQLTGNDIMATISPILFIEGLRRSKTYLRKLRGASINLEIHIFPDPVGHFGVP